MVPPSPSERMATQERINRLEYENQRLREIISDKADNEAYLLRRVHERDQIVDALRGELRLCQH